jgi:hypothetical protein
MKKNILTHLLIWWRLGSDSDIHSSIALVVQRIGHRLAEPAIEVRFLSRAQNERSEIWALEHAWEACVEESKTLRAFYGAERTENPQGVLIL